LAFICGCLIKGSRYIKTTSVVLMLYYALAVLFAAPALRSGKTMLEASSCYMTAAGYVLGVWLFVMGTSPYKPPRAYMVEPPLCDNCGYNLTGNESGVCPECGTKVEDRRVQTPRSDSR
jgi:hypothetical protein